MPIDSYHRELASSYKLLASLFLDKPDSELARRLSEEFEISINEGPEEIDEDYTQIFHGPSDHLPPYESLYNYSPSDSPHLWNRTTEDILKCYMAGGVSLDDKTDLIPDHISAELLFVSYLLENDKADILKSFFREHIIKWIPEYCDMLEKKAKTDFYRELAGITKDIILSDFEELTGNERE